MEAMLFIAYLVCLLLGASVAWLHGLLALVALALVGGAAFVAGDRFNDSLRLQPIEKVHLPCESDTARAYETEARKNEELRRRVKELEEQLRGSEARGRFSEKARERDKIRHTEDLQFMDTQLTSLAWKFKEALRVRDQVICECRKWRRRFEDLESLQQQAQEDPVRGIKGRPRWAPAKSYGVARRERIRPGKDLTAVAKVALVNAEWEEKMRGYDIQVRSHVAEQEAQIRELHTAVTTLSKEKESILQQSVVKPDVPDQVIQKLVFDAQEEIKLVATERHKRIISELKQTHSEELAVAKDVYEKEIWKLKREFEAEKTKFLSQSTACATEPTAHMHDNVLNELHASNARLGEDLRAQKDECKRLQSENCQLQGNSNRLEAHNKTLKEQHKSLEKDLEDVQAWAEDCGQENDHLDAKVTDLKKEVESLCVELERYDLDLQVSNEAVVAMEKIIAKFQNGGNSSDEEEELADAIQDVNLGA